MRAAVRSAKITSLRKKTHISKPKHTQNKKKNAMRMQQNLNRGAFLSLFSFRRRKKKKKKEERRRKKKKKEERRRKKKKEEERRRRRSRSRSRRK